MKVTALAAVLLTLLSPLILFVSAGDNDGSAVSPLFREPPRDLIDITELELFLDDFFAREMERLNIPGAVLSMVQDGETVLLKGYGYADPANRVPADPEKSLFRVASISKLVTATAAMQLYEQDLLDLFEDVNVYLDDFKLPAAFGEPVTMFHLLTHTGGFDDRSVNLAFEQADRVPSLEDYLTANMPPRVMPPGEMISYSNHGLALAGLVVEKIAGVSFIDYAGKNILDPLGMKRSSFLLPPALAPGIATGHFQAAGYNQPRRFDYLYNIAPAASLNSTASDMARFMIAHLQGGRFGRLRILDESTAAEMQSRQFTHHPELAGVCFGFFERFRNDRRFIHHSGLWGGFASLLFLYPEGNLGFFVSLNSGAGTELHENLAAAFADNFLPAVKDEARRPEADPFDSLAGNCTGSYRPIRRSRGTMEKIAEIAGRCRIADLGDGSISMDYLSHSGREQLLWEEAEPFFFRQAGGEEGLAFRSDEQGRVTHLFLGTVAMERLAWYEDAGLHRALGLIFLALFTSAWAGWPLLRARRGEKREQWLSRLPALAAALLNSIFIAGIIYLLVTWPEPLIYGVTPALAVLLALPLVAAVLAAVSVFTGAAAWRNGWWTRAGRLHYIVVVIALLLFVPFLHYWNLIGFRF